jgi:transposase
VNLAYRWFCGLSIEDKLPDHSAFSRARNERLRDSAIFGGFLSVLLKPVLPPVWSAVKGSRSMRA